jgi:hypothetical protein
MRWSVRPPMNVRRHFVMARPPAAAQILRRLTAIAKTLHGRGARWPALGALRVPS